ncbi:hypothetical protein [Methanobrevibacter sp. V14]|nr:hypothetical protein [Methanobrevibacter sp. V14]
MSKLKIGKKVTYKTTYLKFQSQNLSVFKNKVILMAEKYIRLINSSYTIIKNSKNYGKFASLDDARFFRDELIDNAWDLDSIKQLYKFEDTYFVVSIDGKINLLEKYKRKPSQKLMG